jgi:threonine-phosphate decarboxylase
MTNEQVSTLFDLRSHNPSFFSIKESTGCGRNLLDFCIPVNLHFPPPEVLRAVREHLDEILRYYPDYMDVHQRLISEMTGLPPETIVPVNGSTEIITRLCQQAAGPILTSIPTFSRWTDLPVELQIPLHTITRQRECEFRLEVEQIVRRAREVGARTVVISNPNNPTGAALTLPEVRGLANAQAYMDTVII